MHSSFVKYYEVHNGSALPLKISPDPSFSKRGSSFSYPKTCPSPRGDRVG
jgi:hypothetical protein